MDEEIIRNYYTDLGVFQTADLAAIKLAFYKLAKEHHPDKSGTSDTTAFRRAREAYEKLSDPIFRAEYDKVYQGSKTNRDLDEQWRNAATIAKDESMLPEDWSPPPSPPQRKLWETAMEFLSSKAYQEWQVRDAKHFERHPERNAA